MLPSGKNAEEGAKETFCKVFVVLRCLSAYIHTPAHAVINPFVRGDATAGAAAAEASAQPLFDK